MLLLGFLRSWARSPAAAATTRWPPTARPRSRVGYSFGITRILAPLIGKGGLTASRSVPSAVLVAVDNEEARRAGDRRRGPAPDPRHRRRGGAEGDKFGKQIRFAERRGIPFVWFGAGYDDSVKDIRTGDQSPASPDAWTPPAEDARPTVVAG